MYFWRRRPIGMDEREALVVIWVGESVMNWWVGGVPCARISE